MRNWNFLATYKACWTSLVYRLPMRNWNIISHVFIIPPPHVYRLPMRNWNSTIISSIILFLISFIDYLWGIETRWYKIYDKWSEKVYRLPMRNWNSWRIYSANAITIVYRLPMRNWNSSPRLVAFSSQLCL